MNANKTLTDYRRIIETNLNINRPRTPSLLKYHGITKGFQHGDTFWARVPLFNANANDYALMHRQQSEHRYNNVRQFLNDQLDKDDKRRQYKKTCYTRSDFISGVPDTHKANGLETAKIISDANNPPEQVEQDRKMIDYTLRACQYLKRIVNMGRPEIIKRLEPNLEYIDEQFSAGDWDKVHWYDLGMDTPVVDKLNYLFWLHRVHVSLKSPLQIAHYPTLRHMRERREVITKLGKYLTAFKDFIGLNEIDIKNYVEKYNAIVASRTGWEVKFIESNDADGFVNVYTKSKARSCMTGHDEAINNAIKTYAHDKSVLRLAYMQNGADEILARSIVREDSKKYVRVYPDANGSTEGRYLQDYLKANGYSHGDLYGCLLKAIRYDYDEDIFRAPYIDGGVNGNGGNESAQSGNLVEIDGEEFIAIDYDGEYSLTNTNGYTDNIDDDEDYSTCECCEDRVHNDDTTWTWHDEYVCNGCIEDRYYYAWVERGRQEYVHQDNIIEVGDTAYWDDCDFSEFDISYCEISCEWHHMDDLVFTSIGLIHVDHALPITHQDAEGNTYAHHEDVHTLSDGTTCHKDDAEDLQEEINEADREKDDAERAEDQPSRPNDTDGTTLQGQQNETN
jgi:hypothetical protein